jgi:hypothetical protein
MATKVFGNELQDPKGFDPTARSLFIFAYVAGPGEGHPGLVVLPDGGYDVVGEDWGRWAPDWETGFKIVRDMRERAENQEKLFDYVLVPHGFELTLPEPGDDGRVRVRLLDDGGHQVGYVEVRDNGTGRAVAVKREGGLRTVEMEGVGVTALLAILYALVRPGTFDLG